MEMPIIGQLCIVSLGPAIKYMGTVVDYEVEYKGMEASPYTILVRLHDFKDFKRKVPQSFKPANVELLDPRKVGC